LKAAAQAAESAAGVPAPFEASAVAAPGNGHFERP
jgi:hypothetical protein